jgi:steroid delta-isomerase-like uncharacterized protein
MAQDASAIDQGTSSTGKEMTRDQIVALFERRQEAFDNLDAEKLAADYSLDCVIDSPMGGTHRGRAAAQTVLRAWLDAFVDMKMRTDRLLIDGQRVAQIANLEGTHIGTFLGMAPTGKHFQFTGVFVFELRDGQIVHERRIYDFTGLLVQIGVLKAKPVA